VLKYSALLFVAEGSDFSLPAVARKLASLEPRCPDRIDQEELSAVRAIFGDWCLKIAWVDDAQSRAEAERFASAPPNVQAADVVWGPYRLARAWSEDPDPGDEHVDDFIQAVCLLVGGFSGMAATDEGDWWWKLLEEGVNPLVWYAHRHPPRCIAGLCPVPLNPPPPELQATPDAAYFAVGCPCGTRAVYPVGYHTKTMYGQDIFVGPLAVECPSCGRESELIDTRKHGYNGEQGGDCNMNGEGRRGRFPCPRCGAVPMTLMPGFSFEGYYFETKRRRPQDFFGVFWLDCRCSQCGRKVHLVDGFECA
jgi:hypothetical protein